MTNVVSQILFGFTGLIAIINPLGMAFVFLDRTQSLSDDGRVKLARRVAINSMIVLLVTFFVGTRILNFFGISMAALRIGGGLTVTVSGWQMLNAPDIPPDDAVQARPIAAASPLDKAFFPLTMPLTIGPGTIATAIALNARYSQQLEDFLLSSLISVVVAVLVAGVIWQLFGRAGWFARHLGIEGTRIAERISAFLLLCIGVQIMLTGFSEFLQPIFKLSPGS
ncbi:MarC family protein [Paraburkholderia sp. A1RI-2L]|uniref:MarC family protein n=1 Tax=Paraburkholderia sp. A1RI-2L TaxID=3028367 RepID=UPI003B7787C2